MIASFIANSRLEVRLLRGGCFEASHERVLLDDSALDVASMNVPILTRGCWGPDRLYFGFTLAGRGGSMLGQTVIPGSVRVFAEGHEVEYRTAPEVTLGGFQVTREEVERAALRALGPPCADSPNRLAQLSRHRRRTAVGAADPQYPCRRLADTGRPIFFPWRACCMSSFCAHSSMCWPPVSSCSARGQQQKLCRREACMTQRAREYLFANLDQSFSLRALSEAARCSERVLQYAFHEVYGVGPLGWFQAMKLNEANRELRAQGPGEVRVTDVALRWGFTHFGRFSVEYRRMFG